MKKYYWTIILLSLALVAVSVMLVRSRAESSPEHDAAECALNNIMTRSSIREYTDSLVPDSVVTKILKAGMAAPTAANEQAWAFVVVDRRELLDSIAKASPYAGMAAKAPLAIVVCGDTGKVPDMLPPDEWVLDCSAASENILLAAHALGLGAVWCGIYPDKTREADIRRILSLPSDLVPLNIIPMGYPAGPSAPKDKWKPENIHRNSF